MSAHPHAKRLNAARTRFAAWRHRRNLNQLALLYGTDKWGLHWYTQHYARYFDALRHRRITLLEIGVLKGQSLRMWKTYFPKGQIVGVDLEDKTQYREPRIDIRQCDQNDTEGMMKIAGEYAGFDIIVDDGSHRNEDVIRTFKTLFPCLKPDGFYAIEDIQTSYWRDFGGGLSNTRSSMSYFKKLADGLNHAEYSLPDYQPTYFDRNIVEIAFFHNLVVIRKGCNDEQSNLKLIEEVLAQGTLSPAPRAPASIQA